jgi:hypothetical protein
MGHRVTFERTNVSEEHIASIIRVTRISQLLTSLAVTSNQFLVIVNVFHSSLTLFTLIIQAIRSSETSVLNKIHAASHPRRR